VTIDLTLGKQEITLLERDPVEVPLFGKDTKVIRVEVEPQPQIIALTVEE
jgi:hypothetical protein